MLVELHVFWQLKFLFNNNLYPKFKIMTRFMLKNFLLIFFLSAAGMVNAQDERISIEEFTMDNGLHVIMHKDNSSPVVAINVMYHVGSKNEDPERTGFAHFFEHLMFEGSENIPRGEYFKFVQNAGGQNNAFTTFDKTSYYEVLPSNQLELGLWLESERMLHLKIDSIGVETQRKVIKEERKQSYENRPYGSFIARMFENAFVEHPYRWVPIGEVQYIDQATLDEFIKFHEHFYVPNNATLAIAGDIDYAETKKLVKAYFGSIEKGEHEIYRPDVEEPTQTEERRQIVYDNIQLPAVFLGYKTTAEGTADYYALSMLQKLLSDGQSSRLYKSLVDEQQLALQVAAFPYNLEDHGIFITLGLVNMGIDVADLEKALLEEIEKVKTDGLTDFEFEKIQNQAESDFINQNSTMEGIALSLANYYTFFGDANLINTELEKYQKVTREDIVRVANKYLTEDNRVVLHYLPKSEENTDDTAAN